jgi:hypothetical protein
VPVHSSDDGRLAGHPAPFETVPPQFPKSGSFGAWLITTLCPPTVSVATRVSPGFSGTLNETEPGPVPLVPAVTVTNEAFDVTAHAQPLPVFTENVAVAPPPDRLKVEVETE